MICCQGVVRQSLRAAKRILGVILDFFPTIIFEKKCTTCGLCLAVHKLGKGTGKVACWTIPLANLQFQSVWHKSGKRWSTNWDNLNNGTSDFHKASCYHCPIIQIGRGLKKNIMPCKAKRESMHTISRGNGRFTIVILSCSFLRLPLWIIGLAGQWIWF